MLKKLYSVLVLCLAATTLYAQEFNCKVVVMHDKIVGIDNAVFTAMQRNLTEFMNTHKWTNDDFATNEKIDINILFNLTGRVSGDNDGFSATMNIQSTRPIYNSSYTSPMINYSDKDIIFDFSQFIPVQFDDNHVTGTNPLASNLTAILAYYSYLVLGLDYDSFSPLGGTQYFKKAQNIVNNAPEGSGISGWKVLDGKNNRYWLIDQILNTRFEDIRKYWYTMHREGFDNMYTKPLESRQKIMSGIYKLATVNRENPSSVYVQFFFAAKSEEYIKLLSQTATPAERTPFITLLSQMDVPNTQKYNSIK